ncbi:peptidase dimerization domain-containing protein [Streptomyces sp. NPDC046371]|uniref:peptidase dimerization domain-containing protein n=1 Tax=unclassified Streptomyces TaxID=2593676 RepID=UPI00340977A9
MRNAVRPRCSATGRFGRPDVVLAQHTAPLPAGMVAHGTGQAPLTAASVALDVVLHGRGGHAGTPHLTVDPVVTAAAVITRLQTVVSRESAPGEQLPLTVGTVRAGTAVNVVPDTVATRAVRAAHTGLFGPARGADWSPSLASEDFALFGDTGTALHGEQGVPLV